MELAFLLRGVGAEVCWITNQKPSGMDKVVDNLEHKMLGRGVQVINIICAFNISGYLSAWVLVFGSSFAAVDYGVADLYIRLFLMVYVTRHKCANLVFLIY